ncbi:hypothetical protein BP5796_01028 [Coleophoma crateriformis]|uniref:protein-ribulosamine 3-kinase n=1 Tax=Coleophoma crateriformis TaxID=565419 RepID=A0A3D8T9Q8_9HELO|nr:hypothetical protein BP5796_01028 [Coleophoma crateriformis]
MPSSSRAPDPAILTALNLDPQTASIASHGGSGFSETLKLVGRERENTSGERQDGGLERVFFVKMGKEGGMFEGEHQSLNALSTFVPSLCPTSHAFGPLSRRPNTYFLATDFLDLSSSLSSQKATTKPLSLAWKLAILHSTPAPIPAGFSQPQFGFPVPTYCGNTVQDNTYTDSWAEFYGVRRLRHVVQEAERRNGADAGLRKLVEDVIAQVVPALLRDGHLRDARTGANVTPVVVHGDLWSGNFGVARILTPVAAVSDGGSDGMVGRRDGEVGEVVFDPSSCYAHAEYDHGIMNMFGGFRSGFWREYFKEKPKDEPVSEYEDRVDLYELYHHLNHYSMFGGSYKGGAVSIMKRLLGKFGKGGGSEIGD